MSERTIAGSRPGSCGTCPLRAITIYGGLDPQDGEELTAIRREVQDLPAKADLFQAGQKLESVATLFDGWAFRYTAFPDGSRQILQILLPGDTVGLSALLDEPAQASVQGLTDCIFCLLDRDRLRAYAQPRRSLRQQIFRTALHRQAVNERRLAQLGRRTAKQRVAAFLTELEARLVRIDPDAAGNFPFPLRQMHVADALGLTPVHVSRVFRELQTQAILRRSGRRIEVLDRPALARLAGVPGDGDDTSTGAGRQQMPCQ